MRIERLTSMRTARGPLFCPRCCWKLGRAESPMIGYLIACGGCKRAIRIVEANDGAVSITVEHDPRDEVQFIDLGSDDAP